MRNIRPGRISSVFFLAFAATSSAAQSDQNVSLAYPEAPQGNVTDNYHGDLLADPYRWMENNDSPEFKTWVTAQTDLTKTFLKDATWDKIRTRMAQLENYDLIDPPIEENGKLFYSVRPSITTSRTSIFVSDAAGGEPRKLISHPYHYKSEIDPELLRFGGFLPSRTGKTLSYSSSADGSRWHDVRFIDVDSGELFNDRLKGVHQISGSGAWAPDKETFYYTRFNEPEGADKTAAPIRNGRIFLHRVGTEQSEDRLIYEPENDDEVPILATSLDGHYIITHLLDPKTQKTRIVIINESNFEAEEIFKARPGLYTYLDNQGDDFWFYTNHDADNGKIIRFNLETKEIAVAVPEQSEPMSGGSLIGGNALGKFGKHFVVMFVADGQRLIRTFDLEGRPVREVPLPIGGSVWGGFYGRADNPEFYFGLLDMFEPRAVYKMNAETGEYTLETTSKPESIDPNDYVIRQVSYESADGTTVPMFVTHKKGLKMDGSHPAFLYGYGAFGWNSFLFYQSHLIAWLEMGGIYAQPAVRGGGEFGEAWRNAGKGANKENTISDFIAAAEWLVANGYSHPNMLTVNGGSASSMPAAIAMQRRPDLFGAAILDRPVFDMLRFYKYAQGRFWIDEFGTPDTVEGYRSLRNMSPYHTLQADTCYPATLVMTGEVDQSAIPMHSYKYVARMQHNQSCDNPVLLYLMPKTGHSFGSTPEQVVDSRTAMVVFLQKIFGEGAFTQ